MIGFIQPPCEAGVIRATSVNGGPLSQGRKRLTLAATIFGSSMAFVDGSVVNVALPAIQHALRPLHDRGPWEAPRDTKIPKPKNSSKRRTKIFARFDLHQPNRMAASEELVSRRTGRPTVSANQADPVA
jgi:hypothetical protein